MLAEVRVRWEKEYYSRPRPQPLFETVAEMVRKDRWSPEAKWLCEPPYSAPVGAGGRRAAGSLQADNSALLQMLSC